MCECLKIEETLIAAGQILPIVNEITDDYLGINFSHCPVCGNEFSLITEDN